MRWRDPRVWIAGFSGLGVLVVVLNSAGRTSPGPLTAVHQREPDLASRRGCSDCHGGWRRTMRQACLECHGDVGAQIEAGEGLHGALEPSTQAVCALCHSEHHGADFPIVNAASFAIAGVADPANFDHALIGWTMDGKHLEQECTKCHEHAEAEVLPQGARRYLGLVGDCATCHEDPHEGRLAAVACAGCHGQADWKEGLASEGHERFLPLVGGHGDVSCRECHAERQAHALEVLAAPGGRGRPADRTCQDCHESPHAPRFVAEVAAQARLRPATSCVECHAAEHTSFREEGLTVSPAQHACSGFPIGAPHDEVACDDCHAPDGLDFRARYPGRSADACDACHEDVHEGQFEDGPFGGRGCLGCHERLHFEPHAFTVAMHAETGMVLEDSHREAECRGCHELPAGGGARVFDGTPARCEGCHADGHDGYFDALTTDLAALHAGTCARCHLATRFSEVPLARFDHGYWTGFALEGAHAQGACEECHPRAAEPDSTGRTFGWVEEHFGPVEDCRSCHGDPHQREFDGEEHPARVEGRTGCLRCHQQTSFRAFPGGWDHWTWTGFPLEGAHASSGCSACHEPMRRPDEHGRTWRRAKSASCSGCHADGHAGQFEVDGRTDCKRCHAGAEEWTATRFDHDRHSRFPLDEAHEPLACAACHKPWIAADGREIVRYKPLGTQCVDCHGVRGERAGKEKDQ